MKNTDPMRNSIHRAKTELNIATTYGLKQPGNIAEALEKARYHIDRAFEELGDALKNEETRL